MRDRVVYKDRRRISRKRDRKDKKERKRRKKGWMLRDIKKKGKRIERGDNMTTWKKE